MEHHHHIDAFYLDDGAGGHHYDEYLPHDDYAIVYHQHKLLTGYHDNHAPCTDDDCAYAVHHRPVRT